ncbi:MAG: NADH-quinone oxidoreductase subunit NuoG [Solirubrobacterales bacterium]|nr:NADH-quinone oxidoreductase subunit NuoG [Solirubrobacterales bacterium]
MPRTQPNRITLTIDGREIEADEGTMLVDAAREGDVEIPVFCYEPKLGEPVGACRMCLVEIEGIPKLQTSCSTPVRDGMVVHTRTDQVKEAQESVVEFLLVNHPLDCPVCDKGGECPLQDISMGWGPDRNRMVDQKRHFEKPVPLSPLVAIDRERCILCYRCVRFSQEVSEDEQLQLLERGDATFVGTFDDRPYIAPFQGNITELCPVGALTSYTYRFRARPWDIEQGGSVCTLCPSQCNVSFTVRDEQVARVLARDNPEVDDGWLCDKGRYAFQAMYADDRVLGPEVTSDGHSTPASWQEAEETAAEGLASAGSRTAILVGDASNEEGYLLQRILRQALGSGDIDSRRGPGVDGDAALKLADPAISAQTSDIDTADLVIVVGTDPIQSAPSFDLRVRKAVRRNGTALAVASDRPGALEGGATEVVRFPPGGAPAFLEELAGKVKRGRAKTGLAGLIADSEQTVIVWGERIVQGAGGRAAVEALVELSEAAGLADQEGSGLIGIPDNANGRGLREVGCLPDAGPGLSPTGPGRDAGAIREGLESGELEAVVLFGVDPIRDLPDPEGWRRALEAAGHVVAFSLARNESTEFADVLLPLESHAEKDGTVTHPDGRIQRVRPSARRPGEVRPVWQVLTELAAMLGSSTGITSTPEALEAVASAVPFYAGLTDSEIGGRGVRWQERPAAKDLGTPSPDLTLYATAPGPFSPLGSGAAGLEADEASVLEPASGVGRSHTDSSGGTTPPSSVSDLPTPKDGQLLLGTYPNLWADQVVESSPALRFLVPAQRLEISGPDATRLGLSTGDEVSVRSGEESVNARVAVRAAMPEGACFLIEGTPADNGNRVAGEDGGPTLVEIGPPEVRLELVTSGGGPEGDEAA